MTIKEDPELIKLVSESIELQKSLNSSIENLISISQKISVDVSNSNAAISIILRDMLQSGLRQTRILEAIKKDQIITLEIPFMGEAKGVLRGIKEDVDPKQSR